MAAPTIDDSASLLAERMAVAPQYLLPKQAITAFAGLVANWRGGDRTARIIRRFVAKYGVDMGEAAESDIAAYASFNDFFTRALRPGVRRWPRATW